MAATRRTFLKTVGAGLVAASAGPPRLAAAQQLVSFKIGPVVLGDFSINAPLFVAAEKGFFRGNGIAAEMVPFKGGPDLLKGVLSGAVELGVTGATDPFVFRERGAMIRAVAEMTKKNHFTLVVAPKITKLEDLKGGTIGVTATGSTTWVFARLIAKKMGWDPERDVRIVGAGGIDSNVAGMRRGELQGIIVADAGAVVEAEGVGRILMRLDEITPKWVSIVAYATDETIRSKKDTLRKVLRAYVQGDRFVRDNPEESIRIAAKGIGWSEAATRRAYELVRPLLTTDGQIDLEGFKFVQDTLLEVGVLKKRLPFEDHYTTEFTPVGL
jgi:ABC-type nitrate/sulfonate/bicarbonate transport system substrate-binding protein